MVACPLCRGKSTLVPRATDWRRYTASHRRYHWVKFFIEEKDLHLLLAAFGESIEEN